MKHFALYFLRFFSTNHKDMGTLDLKKTPFFEPRRLKADGKHQAMGV